MAESVVGSVVYKIEGDTAGFDNAIKGAGIAIAGLSAAIGKAALDFGNYADKLLDLEQITGLSTDSLQELENVARVAGVNFDGLTGVIQKFTARLPTLETGSSESAKAFESLGVSLRDANGEIRSTEQLFPELIESLRDIENVTERNVTAQQVFGKQLQDLAPVLGLTAEQYAQAQADAENYLQTQEELQEANEFRIEVEKLQAELATLTREVAKVAIPIIQDLLPAFKEIGKFALELVGTFANLVDGFMNLPGPVQATIGILLGLVVAVPKVVAAITAVKGAVIALQVAVAGPVGLVVAIAALVGVVAVFLGQQSQAAKALSDLANETGVAEDAIEAISKRYDTLRQTNTDLNKVVRDLSTEFNLESDTIEKLIANTNLLTLTERNAEQKGILFADQLVLLTKTGLTYNAALEKIATQYGFTTDQIEEYITRTEQILNLDKETLVNISALDQARANEQARVDASTDAARDALQASEDLTRQIIETAGATGDYAVTLDELNNTIAANSEETDKTTESTNKLKDSIGQLLEQFKDPGERTEFLAELNNGFNGLDENIKGAADTLGAFNEAALTVAGSGIRGITQGFAGLIAGAIQGEASFADFGKAILNAISAELLGQAASFGVRALGQTAEGFAALANPLTAFLAPGYFNAAGQFGGAAAAATAGAGVVSGLSGLIDSRQVGGTLVPLGGQAIQVNEGPTQERITVTQTTAQSQRGGGQTVTLNVTGNGALFEIINNAIINGKIKGKLRE